jgi:hypothetical protein
VSLGAAKDLSAGGLFHGVSRVMFYLDMFRWRWACPLFRGSDHHCPMMTSQQKQRCTPTKRVQHGHSLSSNFCPAKVMITWGRPNSTTSIEVSDRHKQYCMHVAAKQVGRSGLQRHRFHGEGLILDAREHRFNNNSVHILLYQVNTYSYK